MGKDEDRRILICDGKSSRRDTLASRFRLQGFFIELSGSGFQTLSMIEKDIYDSLIIIENCDDMSGFELLSLARNIYEKEELHIIYIGKSVKQEEILKYFHTGANDYIVYSDKVFGSLLEKVIENKPSKLKKAKKGMMNSLES